MNKREAEIAYKIQLLEIERKYRHSIDRLKEQWRAEVDSLTATYESDMKTLPDAPRMPKRIELDEEPFQIKQCESCGKEMGKPTQEWADAVFKLAGHRPSIMRRKEKDFCCNICYQRKSHGNRGDEHTYYCTASEEMAEVILDAKEQPEVVAPATEAERLLEVLRQEEKKCG